MEKQPEETTTTQDSLEKYQEILQSLNSDDFLSNYGAEASFYDSFSANEDYRFFIKMAFDVNQEYQRDHDLIDEIYKRVIEILKTDGLDGELQQPNFPHSMVFVVYPKSIDGRLNWKRYLWYPEKFSDENKRVLDTLAGFEEIQEFMGSCKGDSGGKFNSMVRYANHIGLITNEEFRSLENEYHIVAH